MGIHDDLYQAVFAAYGWPSTLGDEEILERLVALNAERAAEEARGLIRWLRPEFQALQGAQEKQGQLTLPKDEETKPAKKPKTAKATKTPWPKERSQRTKAIQDALAAPITPPTSPNNSSAATLTRSRTSWMPFARWAWHGSRGGSIQSEPLESRL